MKSCPLLVTALPIPGATLPVLRGPLGLDDPVQQRLSEAGFVPGESVVLLRQADLEIYRSIMDIQNDALNELRAALKETQAKLADSVPVESVAPGGCA